MLSPDVDSPITTISETVCNKKSKIESCWSIMLQVFPTYIIAGLGMVAAGVVLNQVQYWPVFTEVGVIIMVPALLGLKGNLEMTLASRLSTACNLGKLDCKKTAASMILGNLILVQCQGIVVGFLASLVGMAMGWLPAGKFDIDHGLLLCASAVVTASIASLALGLVMIGVILLAKRLKCNPDNVATPIAASLGDVTTLGLLAWIANLLHDEMLGQKQTALIVIVAYFLVLPFLFYLSYKNEHTCLVLHRLDPGTLGHAHQLGRGTHPRQGRGALQGNCCLLSSDERSRGKLGGNPGVPHDDLSKQGHQQPVWNLPP